MKIIQKIKNMFTKKTINISTKLIPETDKVSLSVPIKRLIENYDLTKKNILIIDDSKGIISMINDFLDECLNVKDYNVLSFFQKYAPFIMMKTFSQMNMKSIDFAIIDIVLPGKMQIKNKYVKYDGIDVAIYLYEKYNCKNFLFYTGNLNGEFSDYFEEKSEKFEKYFGRDIHDFIVYKGDYDGDKTITEFKKLFSGEKYTL